MAVTSEQPVNQKQIYHPDEAAELIGMRPQTLAVWRVKGTGPAYVKCGRAVRYRRADLERWLDSQTVGASK